MITVSKSELKARMLEYFRRVEQTGEEILVTSHNVPTLRVVPVRKRKSVEEAFADLRGKVSLDDSIMQPETDEWELEDDPA